MSGFEAIELVLTRPVQAELDSLKGNGNGRRASRARAASTLMRELLASEDGTKRLRNSSPVVDLRLDTRLRVDPSAADVLHYEERDDQLVGTVLGFQKAKPDSAVRLLTNDTGPMASAKTVGVTYQVTPEDWFLLPEDDESSKQAKALKDELDLYKNQEPKVRIEHGNVSTKRFSVVPLLASLLSGLETPVRISIGDHEISIGLGIPFAWQILLLSSLFFFLALGLYTWRCPKFIKKFHNFTEYQAVGHAPRWTVYEIRFLKLSGEDLTDFTQKLKTKLFAKGTTEAVTEKPVVQETQTIYRYRSGRKNLGETIQVGTPVLDGDGNVMDDAGRGLFWEVFAAFSGSRVYTRALILFLLACSGLCFAFVLGQHVIHGWDYVKAWILPFWANLFH